jgi:hypothetical protein
MTALVVAIPAASTVLACTWHIWLARKLGGRGDP